MTSYQYLLLETAEGIPTLTLNRPKVLNALTEATLRELGEAVAKLEADPAVKVIILTGAGEKAFAAGGDLAAVEKFGPLEAREFALLAQGVLNAIEGCRKPVIAAVNGYAVGGGCELAMACDIRIASTTARFGQPEVNLGILAGWAGTQRLPRLVGRGRALELLLTGDLIDAVEAHRIGLVNRVTAPQEMLETAREMARKIAGKPQTAVRLTREALSNGLEMDSARAGLYEADLFGLCFATEDQKEGMRAFLEKRPPQFKDR